MSRRTLATVIAVPLMVGLWIAAALVPVPYVTSSPGTTIDVLATANGQEIIQVEGARTYYDGGELRMTTVASDRAEDDVTIFEALRAWASDDEAVQPWDAVYREDETNEDNEQRSHLDMVTSQDEALAVALDKLGHDVRTVVTVGELSEDSASAGILEPGDQLLRVGTTRITDFEDVYEAVAAAEAGEPLPIVIRRDGERRVVEVVPRMAEDGSRPLIGVVPGTSYDFPVRVQININPAIGGPSAGLMFALAIYDTLTEGSLTGGRRIAGTGTIDSGGQVGSIGGIQQKIAGARMAGSELFLVPAANCPDATGANNGDMRLAKVATFDDAVAAIEAFAADQDAALPSC